MTVQGSASTIQVLVADSNQLQRDLLATAFRRKPEFIVDLCPAELEVCKAKLGARCSDVLLYRDCSSDTIRHGEVIAHLHTRFPKLAIVLLLDTHDRETVISALQAGARGLFSQSSESFISLCRCIHAVHNGQIWTNMEQMQFVVQFLEDSPVSHVAKDKCQRLLTKRENQVVGLVAEGLTNRSISDHLHITENSVKKSLQRIFDKLGVSNRLELALYVVADRESSGEHSNPLNIDHSRLPLVRLVR